MESYLIFSQYDLVSPDGKITKIKKIDKTTYIAEVLITNISDVFVGFHIDKENVHFNLKSTLAQLGINSYTEELDLSKDLNEANLRIRFDAIGPVGEKMIPYLKENTHVGKLFAADESRKVREPEYLKRMFGRCDMQGNPLLSFGFEKGREDFILKKIDGYTVAVLPIKKKTISYHKTIESLLPTIGEALKHSYFHTRGLIKLHQKIENNIPTAQENNILLVKTAPLHIRTVFAKIKEDLLPLGYHHTSASVLQPDTQASGDIYELYGNSDIPITEIPLEFYTLESHREYVFFSDRDQLQERLDHPISLFKAFKTAPAPDDHLAAVFVVKGHQLDNLSSSDWISRNPKKQELPGFEQPSRQNLLIEKYIQEQPSYPFLKAIEQELITSQGILLCRHFPTPLLKKMLLSSRIQRCLKRIYFQLPSRSHQEFFSHEDRAFLADLAKFALPVYWVDKTTNKILQYTMKPNKDTGMFVPLDLVETFKKASFFGVYGSNLIEGNFENELIALLKGVQLLKTNSKHPLLTKDIPLALMTGGGPGAMEVGNRVAQKVNILSCANIVDFKQKDNQIINEQRQNSHIEAKMTYRLDKLVERQAEFHLDFPLFLPGGIGMDFEYTLEEVRRKTGSCPITPILLFGDASHWQKKITSRFQCNKEAGTIKGSEWVSNCFYSVQSSTEGIKVYQKFINGSLEIGKTGPIYENGFCIVSKDLKD